MSHTLTDKDAETYLELGVTPREIVLLRYPEATDADCDWVLWELTPFPMIRGVHDLADFMAEVDWR